MPHHRRRRRRPKYSDLPARLRCGAPPAAVLRAFAATRAALADAKEARIVSAHLLAVLFVVARRDGTERWSIGVVDAATGALRRVPLAAAKRAGAADLVPLPVLRGVLRRIA